MLLTPEQLRKISEIIQRHHASFIATTVGHDVIPPEILTKLKAAGMLEDSMEEIRRAFVYGQALHRDPVVASMDAAEFEQYLDESPIPLSDVEEQAIEFARHQAGRYITGLGQRIDAAVAQKIGEYDQQERAVTRDDVRTKLARNIDKRETLKELRSDLGWMKRDWERDWDRIAVTEKQNAFQHGIADAIAEQHGVDAPVAKLVQPDACPHCLRLHLGPDGNPIIHKLSDLVANGTNVGRKAAD